MNYFDYTATTPISDSALTEYVKVSKTLVGNPSSTHNLGLEAKQKLEECRQSISEILRVNPSELFFTSGGTESDNIIIQSLLGNVSKGEVIFSGIEHSAVLENKRILESNGWKVRILNCPNGYLKPEDLKNALNSNVRMVCVMAVNNVTGTIQDLGALIKVVRDSEKEFSRKIHFHCDAVQALGKIHFYPSLFGVDSAAFSAHKFYGPRGIGILYNSNKSILPLSKGGGQESGLRAGTENLPAIAAMTTAMNLAVSYLDENYSKVSLFRNQVEKVSKDCGFTILSPASDSNKEYSPYILNISVKPLPSEVFLRIMGDKGFCLSAGSACSANTRGKAESVLTSMNFQSSDRMSSIRISFGTITTQEEVDSLCEALISASKDSLYGKQG